MECDIFYTSMGVNMTYYEELTKRIESLEYAASQTTDTAFAVVWQAKADVLKAKRDQVTIFETEAAE